MSTITNVIAFQNYPYWPAKTLDDVKNQLLQITTLRKSDISTISQISSSFVSGRKVGKIPTSSTDVQTSDKVGDVSYNADYFYILVSNNGTPAWRRIALSTW